MDLLLNVLGTLFLILYTALTAAVMTAIVVFAFQREFWMSGASGFLALILIGLALVAAASMMTDKITLEAANWQCLKQEPRETTTYVQAGKAFVPFTSTTQECVVYAKKGKV